MPSLRDSSSPHPDSFVRFSPNPTPTSGHTRFALLVSSFRPNSFVRSPSRLPVSPVFRSHRSCGLTRLPVSPVLRSRPSSSLIRLPVSPIFRSHPSSGLTSLPVSPVLRSCPSCGLARLPVSPVLRSCPSSSSCMQQIIVAEAVPMCDVQRC